jgi:hypothetical protein
LSNHFDGDNNDWPETHSSFLSKALKFLGRCAKVVAADCTGAAAGGRAGTVIAGPCGTVPGAIIGGVASSVAKAVDEFVN